VAPRRFARSRFYAHSRFDFEAPRSSDVLDARDVAGIWWLASLRSRLYAHSRFDFEALRSSDVLDAGSPRRAP
jgi:hypothetical protein